MKLPSSQSILKILFLFVIIIAISCKKKEEVNPNPEITFQSVSSNEVTSFDNNLIISISYIDHQGDIGETDPDKKTVKIKDSRLDEADWYHIQPITPDLQELDTKGEFTVTLPPLFMLGNGSQESTMFSIQIIDRAGNLSNTITTPSITIIE